MADLLCKQRVCRRAFRFVAFISSSWIFILNTYKDNNHPSWHLALIFITLNNNLSYNIINDNTVFISMCLPCILTQGVSGRGWPAWGQGLLIPLGKSGGPYHITTQFYYCIPHDETWLLGGLIIPAVLWSVSGDSCGTMDLLVCITTMKLSGGFNVFSALSYM